MVSPCSESLLSCSSTPKDEVLSVSVVTFHSDAAMLVQTFSSLLVACRELRKAHPGLAVRVFLIDNGGDAAKLAVARDAFLEASIECSVLTGHGNIGYARGHNLSVDVVESDYHLVLNPDIDTTPDALERALDFLDAYPDAGLLTPYIGEDGGGIQYLCRRFPTLFDLFARGFLPARIRQFFDVRLARYEMRDVINDRDIVWDPPIVSGCFMLFRTEVLKKLGGFDPRYFLYFEDYDLSLRTHDVARVAYVPSVRVIHHGGGASRKGFAHIRMFAASAFKFYNRFGWRLW
ncbi:glycosyltransferase family 2 protein [Burkholderia sp. MSMB1835]|uniref:glycosyltransferase family 2 protein n=1 Tax=Burkholderia sp. MSMB1835 TaxID=1637876 RepID=UPI00075D48FC|nr:glycosyltransferase family 2 protein [Burkholderia sp. MSMB1835]KVL26786.1 glycosyl transferase [Burkholderia sp. MSMB1835]